MRARREDREEAVSFERELGCMFSNRWLCSRALGSEANVIVLWSLKEQTYASNYTKHKIKMHTSKSKTNKSNGKSDNTKSILYIYIYIYVCVYERERERREWVCASEDYVRKSPKNCVTNFITMEDCSNSSRGDWLLGQWNYIGLAEAAAPTRSTLSKYEQRKLMRGAVSVQLQLGFAAVRRHVSRLSSCFLQWRQISLLNLASIIGELEMCWLIYPVHSSVLSRTCVKSGCKGEEQYLRCMLISIWFIGYNNGKIV